MKQVSPQTYFLLALFFTAVGILLGISFYILDVGNYSYLFTIYPSQTSVNIQTSRTFYSIMIFVGGAFFSTGLAMLTSLIVPKDH
jgi:hypothetical protein